MMKTAIKCALRLIKYRPRSESELRQRLKQKNFTGPVIDRVVIYFKQQGLVNDLEFAREWIASRIKKAFGFKRMRQELSIKGIAPKLIERALDEAQSKYSEEEAIKVLIASRKGRFKTISPDKAKQRIYLYLMRRGFATEKIQEAINQT